MLRNAWYAICETTEVSDTPLKRTLHGEDLIIYRNRSGRLSAFGAYCPHRGCDLSMATVAADKLICPFHGWEFDERGICTHIPANRAGAPIPQKAHLTALPVMENAGLVWLYTGPSNTAAAPTFSTFPELNQPDWRYVWFQQRWQAHFTRTVESVLDVSHLPFVHPETTGTDVDPTVKGPDYIVSGERLCIYPTPFAPAHPMEPVPPAGGDAQTEIELRFPNQWMIRTPVGNDNILCTFLTFTPIDATQTEIFGIVMRNFETDSNWFDEFHLDHTRHVMEQDKVVIESLRPAQAPFHLQTEAHVPSDVPTIRFRVMLREALQKEAHELQTTPQTN